MNYLSLWETWRQAAEFSGVFAVRGPEGLCFERCQGLRLRSEGLPCTPDTAFGVASVTKMFTGLAVCMLIEAGKLALDAPIWDIIPHDLGRIDRRVTVRHLLTHTSGIGDYIDEERDDAMERLQALYARYPVYLWENLDYYLPMTADLPPKFEPGAQYSYCNSGFVLLGLCVEAASGRRYQDYVTEAIINKLCLARTGFYRADALPPNTAVGYFEDASGALRSNVFSMPIIGGADGGLYTTAADLDTLWRGLFDGQLLGPDMLAQFLHPHVQRKTSGSYGLGVYRQESPRGPVFFAVGGDFGVDCFTLYVPSLGVTASSLSNFGLETGLMSGLIEGLTEDLGALPPASAGGENPMQAF